MPDIKQLAKRVLRRMRDFYCNRQRMKAWKSLKRTIAPEKMTYYPEAPRKTREEILREMEDYILKEKTWRMDQVIANYFMLGLDRKGGDISKFVLEPEYERVRAGRLSGIVHILRDKKIVSMYLRACGVRISCAVGQVEDGSFLPVDNSYRTPFAEWLRDHAGVQYFMKLSAGLQGKGCFRAVYDASSGQYQADGKPVSAQDLEKMGDGCIVEPRLIQHAQFREISGLIQIC